MAAFAPNNEYTLADIIGLIANGISIISWDYVDRLNDPFQECFASIMRYFD